MKAHWYAKIFGYGQFALQVANAIAANHPHGVAGWLGLATSALAAGGIHFASITDGSK